MKRDGQDRATAIPAKGDTIRGLANIISLNTSDWKAWLQAFPSIPNDLTLDSDASKETCSYSVPNTGFIDVSTYTIGVLGDALLLIKATVASRWGTEGLKVVYTGPWSLNRQDMIQHFASKDIYRYMYIGHGADDGWLYPGDWFGDAGGLIGLGGEQLKAIDAPVPYHIRSLELISCYSDLNANAWQNKVSQFGNLETVKGKFDVFHQNYVNYPGTP